MLWRYIQSAKTIYPTTKGSTGSKGQASLMNSLVRRGRNSQRVFDLQMLMIGHQPMVGLTLSALAASQKGLWGAGGWGLGGFRVCGKL